MKQSRAIVIDADVARAAGGELAEHPTPRNCRAFLEAVRTVCHRVVMTPAIRAEWDKHQSSFFRTWRTAMESRGKIVRCAPPELADLRVAEAVLALTAPQQAAVLKDFHLIEAALATEKCLASKDETARGLFGRLARLLVELRPIVWVNPDLDEDDPLTWLRQGAKPLKKRQLGLQGRGANQ